MSHMHFGRVVPITFRRFPTLICHNLLGRTVRVPHDLQGQLSVLVVGFKAAHYDDMNSWIPFTTKLQREIKEKHNLDVSEVQSYRLVIRHRAGVFFRWWTDERLRFAVGIGYSEPNAPLPKNEGQKVESMRMSGARGALGAAGEQQSCVKVESANSYYAGQSPEGVRLARLQEIRSRTLVCFTDKSAFVDTLQLADAQRVYIFLLNKEGDIAWCEHEQYSASKEVEIRGLLQLPKADSSALPTCSHVSPCRTFLPSADGSAGSSHD